VVGGMTCFLGFFFPFSFLLCNTTFATILQYFLQIVVDSKSYQVLFNLSLISVFYLLIIIYCVSSLLKKL